jgi:hypothetical protein
MKYITGYADLLSPTKGEINNALFCFETDVLHWPIEAKK